MASAEAYSWMEGEIWLWTGEAAASAEPQYAQSLNFSVSHLWDNRKAASGNYFNVKSGQRADVTIGGLLTQHFTVPKMFESGTAVHMKLMQSSVNGTAGYILYSGRIDSIQQGAGNNGVFQATLAYHANDWTAFGG